MDKIFAELEDLLSATFAELELRQQTTFDVLAGPLAAKIVLYGAGGLGRKMLATGGAGAGVSAGGDIVVEAITLDGQDLTPPPPDFH